MGPLALEAILLIQLTIGVLSHNVPNGICFTSGAVASITPTARTSAANSRSEFVRRHSGLSSETTSDSMSGGNTDCQTNGGMSLVRENHTPPAPATAAS
jgi:hypothetical protein